ncbi:hypothetical protein [Streptomyces sp. NPDC052107]|uniref:hypothetical protein n=1 Tax=Streptomyces sp. NPDC052107 TaxID=3155632 RepID=UPI0034193478
MDLTVRQILRKAHRRSPALHRVGHEERHDRAQQQTSSAAGNPHSSKHGWIRLGTKDSDTSHAISANLAAAAAGRGDEVDHLYYWDQGHGANTDPGDFITWIGKVTGHRARKR